MVWTGAAVGLSIKALTSLGGAWCFHSTRVRVITLFEHLDKDSTIDEFIEWFPAVTREQVHEVLASAKDSLEQPSAVA